jgi:hypothetical protein
MDDVHPDLAGGELLQRVGEGLGRSALVGLDDQAQRGDLAVLEGTLKSSSVPPR